MEIFHNGAWGTVCDDSWDMNEAQVVCRQLRFPGAREALQSAAFGNGKEALLDCDMRKFSTIHTATMLTMFDTAFSDATQ